MNDTMDIIQVLLSYVAYIVFLGTSMFFVLKLLRDRRMMVGLKQISACQARLAMLRINFKAKVKKKALQFRASFRKSIPKGEVADLALEEMVDLKFETGEDFQKYFDLCKKVNVFLKADAPPVDPSAPPANAGQVFEDFMSSDFKNELAIIRLIKEMTEVSADLNRKIDSYNNMNLAKAVPKVDSLYFVSLMDVNRVFNDDDSEQASSSSPASVTKVAWSFIFRLRFADLDLSSVELYLSKELTRPKF